MQALKAEHSFQIAILEDQHENPNAAVSDRKFISSALIGRISEPVIRNRTTAVRTHSKATTQRHPG